MTTHTQNDVKVTTFVDRAENNLIEQWATRIGCVIRKRQFHVWRSIDTYTP